VGSTHSMRFSIHAAWVSAWHFGQCRFRQELYAGLANAHVLQTSTCPPSCAVRHARALSLMLDGIKREQVAKTIGCTTESLRRWYAEGKKQGLVTKVSKRERKSDDSSAATKPAVAEPATTSAPQDPGAGSASTRSRRSSTTRRSTRRWGRRRSAPSSRRACRKRPRRSIRARTAWRASDRRCSSCSPHRRSAHAPPIASSTSCSDGKRPFSCLGKTSEPSISTSKIPPDPRLSSTSSPLAFRIAAARLAARRS